MSINMGIGKIGDPSRGSSGRKFRWTIEIYDSSTGGIIVPASFVKVTGRPHLKIEEELDFLTQKKATWWESIITYYDTTQKELSEFYNYAQHQFQQTNLQPVPSVHKADYHLILYDGCGTCMEEWKLGNAFMTAINFGELDYSSSELTTVDVTVRYDKAEYRSISSGVFNKPNLNWDGQRYWEPPPPFVTPEAWRVVNPIITESSSPGVKILDQFLRRTASK